MNNKIELTYKGVPYTLEYNRNAVKILEANGFREDEFIEKPMTNIELAFQCAFIKNHPKITQSEVSEIFNACPDKKGLVVALKTMIDECYTSLLDEPKGDEGNVVWKTVDLSPKKKVDESQK